MRVLELGCGDTPTIKDGYEHLDSRKLPHIEYVQDASDLSNFKEGEFDKVTSRDLIEHISWRKIPETLSEWVRVLKTGGILEIETPNAYEVVEMLLNPYRAGLNRHMHESDFVMFNRTLFGHQDYEGNFHNSYFTEAWLRILLMEVGLKDITIAEESLGRFRMLGIKP
jgi:predicted SAM-dependent methyltransferase